MTELEMENKQLAIELGDLRVLFDREVAANKKRESAIKANFIVKDIVRILDLNISLSLVNNSVEKLKADVIEKFGIEENDKLVHSGGLHPIYNGTTYNSATQLFKDELEKIKKEVGELKGERVKGNNTDFTSLEGRAKAIFDKARKG